MRWFAATLCLCVQAIACLAFPRPNLVQMSRRILLKQLYSLNLCHVAERVKPSTFNFNRILEKKGNRVLIIGCGKAGKSIVNHLRTSNENVHISATTTKPQRIATLSKIVDDVVLIPQLSTGADDALQASMAQSDIIIISDVISIFNIHSYLRTAMRVRQLVDCIGWRGNLVLLSTENAYGSVLNGDTLFETSLIYPNIDGRALDLLDKDQSLWHVNPHTLASIIRTAEATVANGPQRCVIFRTAGIWDTQRMHDAALYTMHKQFPLCLKDSHMAFTTTGVIGKAVAWSLKPENLRKVRGIYNLADINSRKITRGLFYEKLHMLHALPDSPTQSIVWKPDMPLSKNTLFSMDAEPFLPTSQRSNSNLCCNKIRSAGFTLH